MTTQEPVYDVRERTGNPENASVEEVCDRLLSRAAEPRRDHRDSHFDLAIAEFVDEYGEETVHSLVRRILADQLPFRMAAKDGDVPPAHGVSIGTAAVWTLREMNQ